MCMYCDGATIYSQNRFCPPACNYLTPTEEEQDKQRVKVLHWCTKHDQHLRHEDCHPSLKKCEPCKDE